MNTFHDSHCHLTQYKNIDKIIQESLDNKVSKIVAVSMFKRENIEVLNLYKKYPEIIIPALGIHPISISNKTKIDILFQEVESLIKKNIKNLKIIGEIGLDRYFTKDPKILKKQRDIFNNFLSLSEEFRLGVTVHGKYAESEIMDILEGYNIKPIIIHWYSTTNNLIRRGIDNEYYYSVNFSVLYSKKVQNLVKITPIKHLLTESDGPVKYKPINLTGKPQSIPKVVSEIANLKKLEMDKVSINLNHNFKKILNIS